MRDNLLTILAALALLAACLSGCATVVDVAACAVSVCN